MTDTNHAPAGRKYGAFTLIDMLLLASALLVSAALLVPAWESHTVRSRVGECVTRADVFKHAIVAYRQTHREWPPIAFVELLAGAGTSAHCNGLIDYDPLNGSFGLDVNEAAVAPDIGELQPRLTPSVTPSGSVEWQCSRGSTRPSQLRFLPTLCRKLSA